MSVWSRLRCTKGGKVTARAWNRLVEACAAAEIESVVGGRLIQGVSKQLVIPPPQSVVEEHPFKVRLKKVSGNSAAQIYHYTVSAGTINNNVPELLDAESAALMSLAENPKPKSLFLGSAVGTGDVYLHVSATIVAANDFVTNVTETAWKIESGEETPDDDEAAGEYYIRLARFVAGVKSAQYWNTSLSGYYIDNLDGNGEARIYVNGATV